MLKFKKLIKENMKDDKTFQEVVDETVNVVRAFEKVEKRKWGPEADMMELTKQVGELSRNIMMYEGYYLAGRDTDKAYQTSKEKIADELSDVLYMTIRLADYYSIDLEKVHIAALEEAINHPHMKVKK